MKLSPIKISRNYYFAKKKFEFIKISYRCVDTQELYITTEVDEINILQVYNQYRAMCGIPFSDEIAAISNRDELSASKMSKISFLIHILARA